MRTHTFNGVRYLICTDRLKGICIPPGSQAELDIACDLRTKQGLITAIHEALHGENYNWSEKYVERMGREIGTFLWRLGFRHTETKA